MWCGPIGIATLAALSIVTPDRNPKFPAASIGGAGSSEMMSSPSLISDLDGNAGESDEGGVQDPDEVLGEGGTAYAEPLVQVASQGVSAQLLRC